MPKLILTLLVALLLAVPAHANDPVEFTWDELMPEDYTLSLADLLGDFDYDPYNFDMLDDFSPEAEKMLDQMMSVLASAPVRGELDGKIISIPGFVVPLEAEQTRVHRFFLVPYFGACIHVPPPPSNQIIDVHFEPGTQVENLWDAVWVTGRLNTVTFSHEMGTSGYRLEAFQITPYDWDAAEEGEW